MGSAFGCNNLMSGLLDILKGLSRNSHQGISLNVHFRQAAVYLGLRQKEWLFLSCHNYWIVVCLVRGGSKPPFLAVSPLVTMKDSSSSAPSYLLSKVSPLNLVYSMTVRSSKQTLSISDADVDDGSGEYRGHSGQGPITRKRTKDANKTAATTTPRLIWLKIKSSTLPSQTHPGQAPAPCTSMSRAYAIRRTGSPRPSVHTSA